MRTRWLGILAVLSTITPVATLATDAPHDGSFTVGTCENCHKLHNATGGTLLNQPDNNTACTGCHNPLSGTSSGARLGLPWLPEDQATPGKGGQQHRWDALAASPAFGAGLPTDSQMLKRIVGGRIQCAACHDPHADVKAFDPTALHTSIAPGVATAPTVGGNTMTMTLTAPVAGNPATKGYRLYVDAISGGQFKLAISHNAQAVPPTWWVNSGSWVQGALGSGTTLRTPGTAFYLDDGTNVQVNFTGTPAVGQYWDFYISYAHLRASNVADAMCLQCHASRNQNHTTVEGPNLTGAVYSHPVGQALNANAKGYDRAAANVLDANGAIQTTGDGNTTNDLTLVGGTTVSCTTCHNIHNADSNSLTTDAR